MPKELKEFPPFPNFQYCSIVDPRFFVDRNEELSIAWKALFRDRLNLLITGPRGIGKSSFLRKIMQEVSEQPNLKVLPVWLDMQAFHEGPFVNFLNELIERICTTIGTKVLKMNYSELLEDINKHPDLKQLTDKRKHSLFRIYRLVRSKRYDSVRKSLREVGASMIVSGKATESTEVSVQLHDITGYEFLMFIDELKQILIEKGYNTILALCDEANRLSEAINIDILQRYFEIFASKNIQFIFVAAPFAGSKIPEISNAFGCQIKLGKFLNSDCVEELVRCVLDDFDRHGGKSIPFEKICYEKIYDVCEGHPRWMQCLCSQIYETAVTENHTNINMGLVTNCSLKFLKEFQSRGWHFS